MKKTSVAIWWAYENQGTLEIETRSTYIAFCAERALEVVMGLTWETVELIN
jgi:hypothetical protein